MKILIVKSLHWGFSQISFSSLYKIWLLLHNIGYMDSVISQILSHLRINKRVNPK